MKKIALLVVLFFSTTVFSQKKSDFWNHVRFGGGIGLGFGNNRTNIAISPSAIYEFNSEFALGLGLGYQYAKNGVYKSNIFSGSIISLYNPFDEIQLSGEFEHMFVAQSNGVLKSNFDIPALYFGIAYITGRVAIGVRYDVLYNKNKSVYSSPISPVIRVYF